MRYEIFLDLTSTVRNILFLAVSLLFIFSGAVNLGFSGFFFAIPFLTLFFKLIKNYRKKYKYSLITITAIICVFFIWNKPNNKIIFPYIGAKAELVSGWAYVKTSDSNYFYLITPESIDRWKNESDNSKPLELVVLDKNLRLTMDRVEPETEYPTFVLNFKVLFTDSNGVNYYIYSEELLKGIALGDIKSDELMRVESFQSIWTNYLGNLMYWPMLPMMIFN
jgi:hypothetical protein